MSPSVSLVYGWFVGTITMLLVWYIYSKHLERRNKLKQAALEAELNNRMHEILDLTSTIQTTMSRQCAPVVQSQTVLELVCRDPDNLERGPFYIWGPSKDITRWKVGKINSIPFNGGPRKVLIERTRIISHNDLRSCSNTLEGFDETGNHRTQM